MDRAESEAFRADVVAFLKEHAESFRDEPRAWREPSHNEIDALTRDQAGTLAWARRFQAALFDAGLAGLHWPKEYGGGGMSSEATAIYQEEISDFDVPRVTFGVAQGMVGPVLLRHGSEAQKTEHVAAILRGDRIWCQLFSEPGAGSDLAGLRTRAVRMDDEFVINGQKVWSSGAQFAEYGLLLARTNVDVPKHAGITAFILDMHTPGVTVRPLRQMSGAAHFNEVFFDDVHVPLSEVVGEIDGGWRVAITTLMHERNGGANRRVDLVAPVIEQATERGLNHDPVVRQQLADLVVRARVFAYLSTMFTQQAQTGRDPGPQGSMLKLTGAALSKRVAEVGATLCGPDAVAWPDGSADGSRWTEMLLATRRLSIAGGTDEVMRNIIGERLLQLPKEPSEARTTAFKDSPQ